MPQKLAGGFMLKKFAWQRRWFEIDSDAFSWYASAQAAKVGHDHLGRVPRSMIISATAVGEGGGFEVCARARAHAHAPAYAHATALDEPLTSP